MASGIKLKLYELILKHDEQQQSLEEQQRRKDHLKKLYDQIVEQKDQQIEQYELLLKLLKHLEQNKIQTQILQTPTIKKEVQIQEVYQQIKQNEIYKQILQQRIERENIVLGDLIDGIKSIDEHIKKEEVVLEALERKCEILEKEVQVLQQEIMQHPNIEPREGTMKQPEEMGSANIWIGNTKMNTDFQIEKVPFKRKIKSVNKFSSQKEYDFFNKIRKQDEEDLLLNCISKKQLTMIILAEAQNANFRQPVSMRKGTHEIIGFSEMMKRIIGQVSREDSMPLTAKQKTGKILTRNDWEILSGSILVNSLSTVSRVFDPGKVHVKDLIKHGKPSDEKIMPLGT